MRRSFVQIHNTAKLLRRDILNMLNISGSFSGDCQETTVLTLISEPGNKKICAVNAHLASFFFYTWTVQFLDTSYIRNIIIIKRLFTPQESQKTDNHIVAAIDETNVSKVYSTRIQLFSSCPHQRKRALPEAYADSLQNTHGDSGVENGVKRESD